MKGLFGVIGASSKNSTMTSGVETGGEERPGTGQAVEGEEELAEEEEEEVGDNGEKEQPREVFLSDGEMDSEDEFFQVKTKATKVAILSAH